MVLKILVLNSGSSSLKYKLFEMAKEEVLFSGHVDGIGLDRCVLKTKCRGVSDEKGVKASDHADAIEMALKSLRSSGIIKDYSEINAVGHRVVHGGEYYSKPTIIDDDVIKRIDELSELAPLHNPANLAGIISCRKMLPKTSQVAVFDTAFHQTMAPENYLYPIPYELYVKDKIRRYGFHGPSHKYVSEQAAKLLGKKETRIITCHLGNGLSITAVKNGKSVVTSMGFTPLEGLMMGTRSGSIDPAIFFYLCQSKGMSPADVDSMLNKKSGLLGISGLTSDMRDLYKAAVRGNKRAKLAYEMFCSRIAFYIAGYASTLEGVDCIVFTAGIGENAYFVRKNVCEKLTHLGLAIDPKANKQSSAIISTPNSKIKIFVIPTNEELEMARETKISISKS